MANNRKLLFVFLQCSYEFLDFILLVFELLINISMINVSFTVEKYCSFTAFPCRSHEQSDTDLKKSNSVFIQRTDDLCAAGPQALWEGQRSEDDSTAA